MIRPTLIKQLRSILDQYPDNGQILKVSTRLGHRVESPFVSKEGSKQFHLTNNAPNSPLSEFWYSADSDVL